MPKKSLVQEGRAVRPLRIVVADDWPDAAESLAILLKMHGHLVDVVHDGLLALETARSGKADVALLDAAMPKMTGLEVASILSGFDDKPLLICVSGFASSEDRAKAFSAGFDHFFTKPVDIAAILEVLESLRIAPTASCDVQYDYRSKSAPYLSVAP